MELVFAAANPLLLMASRYNKCYSGWTLHCLLPSEPLGKCHFYGLRETLAELQFANTEGVV